MNTIDEAFARLEQAVEEQLGPMAGCLVKYERKRGAIAWYVADIVSNAQCVCIAELSKTSAKEAVDKAISVLKNLGAAKP